MYKTFNFMPNDDAKIAIEVSDSLLRRKGITEKSFKEITNNVLSILFESLLDSKQRAHLFIEQDDKEPVCYFFGEKGEIK